jgi:hypothetical protein
MIPIPLRAPHCDLRLDLQAVLHRVYDAAGYEKFIYDSEPVPPLRPDDAAWARQLVPQRDCPVRLSASRRNRSAVAAAVAGAFLPVPRVGHAMRNVPVPFSAPRPVFRSRKRRCSMAVREDGVDTGNR